MTDKLLSLIERFSGRLPEIHIESAIDYIDHNEADLGLELLLDAICEEDLKISKRDLIAIESYLASGNTKYEISENVKNYLLSLAYQ